MRRLERWLLFCMGCISLWPTLLELMLPSHYEPRVARSYVPIGQKVALVAVVVVATAVMAAAVVYANRRDTERA